MAKSYPPRPSKDFRITCFAWQLDSEANHRNAGLPAISPETLARRFWQYLHFLQEQSLTTRTIAHNISDISSDTALLNSDLTDYGYHFEQRYGDRWIARIYKDTGEANEQKFLVKWYNQFRTESVGA